MTEITNQLRSLGHAAEAQTDAVTPQQILGAPRPIGVDQPGSPGRTPARQRRLAPLLAAAALVVLAIGSFAVLARPDPAAELDTATAASGQDAGSGQSATGPDDDNGWEALRQCESTANYGADTGTTFGAYQFTRASWRDTANRVGLDSVANKNPAAIAPAIQDAIAAAIYDEQRADPWPVCGRFVTGPMVTPLVPQWMGELPDLNDDAELIVFMNPDATPGQIEGMQRYLDEALRGNDELVTYVDQQAAFAEFQELFADTDDIGATVQDMPPSYRIGPGLAPVFVSEIEDLAGVFEVVQTLRYLEATAAPRKLVISQLGIETPMYTNPAAVDLATGAGVIAENERGLVVAGYGSFDGALFAGASELDQGALVQVFELIENPNDGAVELVTTYEVLADAETVPLVEIEAFDEANELVGLVLVADVADDPGLRTVVRLRLAIPDRAAYGLGDS